MSTTITEPTPLAEPTAPPINRIATVAIHLVCIPFSFLGGLVCLLITRKRSPWLHQQSRQALNFQLNLLALKLLNAVLLGIVDGLVSLTHDTSTQGLIQFAKAPGSWLGVIGGACTVWAIVRAYRGAWMPYGRLIPFLKPLPQPATSSGQ